MTLTEDFRVYFVVESPVRDFLNHGRESYITHTI